MAMTTAERSALARKRRAERGETILHLPTLAGTRHQLAELMEWHGIEEMAEAVTLLILNAMPWAMTDRRQCWPCRATTTPLHLMWRDEFIQPEREKLPVWNWSAIHAVRKRLQRH